MDENYMFNDTSFIKPLKKRLQTKKIHGPKSRVMFKCKLMPAEWDSMHSI